MGDSHHFHHHHHHPRPKSQVFCDDDDDDIEFPERSSSSTGLIRHSETHHSVQSQIQKSELEQLRSRVCQMEKTMRWWSDCTSNWKQKWSQVRQERNALRAQLKEITGGSVAPKPEMKQASVQTEENPHHHYPRMSHTAQSMSTAADVHLLTKLLDEAQRTIAIEREEKLHLHRSIERLQQDLVEFHTMYDELVKEVQLLKLDDSSKVSEQLGGDLPQEELVTLVTTRRGEIINTVENVATAANGVTRHHHHLHHHHHPQHQPLQVEEPEELVELETGVDDDDDDDEDGPALEDLDDPRRGSGSGGSSSSRIMAMMMSGSKSQQITSKPISFSDADHHTSL